MLCPLFLTWLVAFVSTYLKKFINKFPKNIWAWQFSLNDDMLQIAYYPSTVCGIGQNDERDIVVQIQFIFHTLCIKTRQSPDIKGPRKRWKSEPANKYCWKYCARHNQLKLSFFDRDSRCYLEEFVIFFLSFNEIWENSEDFHIVYTSIF